MSHTPQPTNEIPPLCSGCSNKATWDSKWADWWCFICDDGSELIQAIEKELA